MLSLFLNRCTIVPGRQNVGRAIHWYLDLKCRKSKCPTRAAKDRSSHAPKAMHIAVEVFQTDLYKSIMSLYTISSEP